MISLKLSKAVSSIISVLMSVLLVFPVSVYSSASNQEIDELSNVIRVFVAHDVVFLEDAKVTRKMRSILTQLLSDNGLNAEAYDFRIINDTLPNVFSGPDGMIYMSTGLLQVLNSDSEVALILAHEIAHHQAGDFFAQFNSTYDEQTAKVVGGVALMTVLVIVTAGVAAAAAGPMGTATTSSTMISTTGAVAATASYSAVVSTDIAMRDRLKYSKTNPQSDVANHPIYATALLDALNHSIYDGYGTDKELAAEKKALSYLQTAGYQIHTAHDLRFRMMDILGEIRQTHLAASINNIEVTQ